MKQIVFLVVLLVFSFVLKAQTPQTVLYLPWGKTAEQAGLRQAPEANYGPQAFAVQNGQVILLDEPQQALKIFSDGQLNQVLSVPPFCDDFLFFNRDNYVVLAQNQLIAFKNGRVQAFFKPQHNQQIIENLKAVDPATVQLQFSDQQSRFFVIPQNRLQKSAGLLTEAVTVSKINEHAIQIQRFALRKVLDFPEVSVASVRFLGSDSSGHFYFNLEFFEQQVPLRIRREIYVTDSSFNVLLRLQVPVNNYTEIFRDWFIDPAGQFYQMFTTPQGVEIVAWSFKTFLNAQNPPQLSYPQRFYQSQHYNVLPSTEPAHSLHKVTEFEDFPQVMPSDALATGDAYVNLSWTAKKENLTFGVVTDAYGNQVRTPDWIVVGQNTHVPYKWGGSETIEAFLYGIEILKYAGDNYTDNGGTPSAVGVDCSGFVSRCWNLPRHFATSMMDDGLTLPYQSWSEAEPGDAVHKVGHVRMVVKQNTNGSLLVVESSGRDWKVSYRTYYYSSLTNYTPRYYVNRQGAPGNIPQPRIDWVKTNGDQMEINWSLEGLENVSTLRIYFSTDGNSWGSGFAVPKDTTRWSVPIQEGQSIYVKLRCFSSGTYQTPGVSSDVYGAFRKDQQQKVLIVDGFDRTSATSGRWKYIYHSFAVTLGKALAKAGIPFETTTNEMVQKQEVRLTDYPAVFWISGDESTRDATFDKEEQNVVSAYLKAGGRLFVSGSEIAYDLDKWGTSYDRTFFGHYLKAAFVEDNAGTNEVIGADGTPFAQLNVHFDDGLHGIYPVPYPDAIDAAGGSVLALKYANGKGAAIYFDGVVEGGSKPAKIFYMGFPFETIYTPSERDTLMSKIVDVFQLKQLSALAEEGADFPKQFELLGNFPNPFNNHTQIRFRLPTAGGVELTVFNALGQRVVKQRMSFATPGLHTLVFDGSRLASGVYIYRLTTDNGFTQSKKMMLVK